MTGGDTAEIERAIDFHRAHGTTTSLASLVSAHPDELLESMSPLVALTRSGRIGGIHLEGPWISKAHCGAHDPTALRSPDDAEVDRILNTGDGAIRMVTLAPELPHALATVTRLVDAGIVVAVGHTDATYQQTLDVIARGAGVGTHLFNAMRGLNHREPGPILALLEDDSIVVELIADGIHLHPDIVKYVVDTVGPERVSLITDATAASGCVDGSYRLGEPDVDVDGGVARVAGTDTIAGSTTTMDRLFRTAVGEDASDAALVAATVMTSSTPAHTVGWNGIGSLRRGRRADLVVLDSELEVGRVMAGGAWVERVGSGVASKG